MWRADQPPNGDLQGDPVEIVETFYEFDGPQIFRGRLGAIDALFRKIGQDASTSLFVAVLAEDTRVELLKAGKISVRGAFDQLHCWVVELDEEFTAGRFWITMRDELPPRLMPAAGAALFHWHGRVPDTVQQATSRLAIKFTGSSLHTDGMPFSKFKMLVDRAYAAARNILAPQVLARSRSTSFDLEVGEPLFDSLVITVKDPIYNRAAIKRNRETRNISLEALTETIMQNQTRFSENLRDLNDQAERNVLRGDYAAEQFVFLDTIAGLLPTDDGDISAVEFTTATPDGTTTFAFDRSAAQIVRLAMDVAERDEVREEGVIDGFSVKSAVVVLQSRRGKEVRCEFERDAFDDLLNAPGFRAGRTLRLRGLLQRRERRDRLTVAEWHLVPRP